MNFEQFFDFSSIGSSILPLALLGALGGIASLLLDPKLSLKRVLVTLFLSAFVGVNVGLYLLKQKADTYSLFIFSNLSGLASEKILRLLTRLIVKKAEALIDEECKDDTEHESTLKKEEQTLSQEDE